MIHYTTKTFVRWETPLLPTSSLQKVWDPNDVHFLPVTRETADADSYLSSEGDRRIEVIVGAEALGRQVEVQGAALVDVRILLDEVQQRVLWDCGGHEGSAL